MPVIIFRYYCFFFWLLLISCEHSNSSFRVYDLTINHPFDRSREALGGFPAFSWKIKSADNGWEQNAYQIIISQSKIDIDKDRGSFWDSGKILSDDQLFIPCKGKPIVGGKKYFWKVKVWQNSGKIPKWSPVQSFITPISYPEDWKAQWITYDYNKGSPMPLFRKTFHLQNGMEVASARLYISGMGYYEAYLNGLKLGSSVLDPAQTNYDEYAFYSAIDIPDNQLGQNNTLGIMLGNGWYNQDLVWNSSMAYGQPLVIAQLIINYETGESDTIATDSTWRWKEGPITFSNIYAGENYNANLEIAYWSADDCEEKDWKGVKPAVEFPPRLIEQANEPIKRMDSLNVSRILESANNKWVFDFGQNFAGWVRLKIEGQKDQKITLRFSEEIDMNNEINPISTGVLATKFVQTDQYICKGNGTEVWEPRFTYHGFRYVEVSGLGSKPDSELLTGIVAYSAMKINGTFTCSNPQINKLHDLAVWTIKSNVLGIPTDCPHRERCGWTGDAHTMAKTLIQNFSARLFLTKYLFDMRSSGAQTKNELYFGTNFHDRSIIQKPAGIPTMIAPGRRTSGIASPDWGTAVAQIPWYLYQYYGDIEILREFYPDMKTWVDYISEKFPEGIVNHGLGDWCPPGGNEMIDCPVPLSSTAFHYLDLSIISNTSALLGYDVDASRYKSRSGKVKEQFNDLFFNTEKNTYGSQTGNVLAIQLGLVPPEKSADVVKSLEKEIQTESNDFIQTGIFGLGRIFPVLAENGAEDLAYELFTKSGKHSFAYMWDEYDATTLWEVLPVDDYYKTELSARHSHNHPMNTGYDEWFFRGIAGIRPDANAPGFKNIVFRPYFTSKLKSAEATYESPYGTIVSKWAKIGKSFIWDIEFPPNTSGVIYIPKMGKTDTYIINDKTIGSEYMNVDKEFIDYVLYVPNKNGKYHIEVTY